jgi:aspartyl-tRNA(Asn)/glutamyl-tRNA(Gln) amidotransferase subunit C
MQGFLTSIDAGFLYMSNITREDVAYVAGLAQLELDEAAQERLLREMGDILTYMDKLNALDTDGVEPMMHAMEMVNVFREDVVGTSLPRELALANAPQHDDEYFLVPKILDNE